MAERTAIAWADGTVNFWWGCVEVSPACANCYAREFADKRLHRVKWGKGEPRLWIESAPDTLAKIARRARTEGKRLRVFVNSMSDIFDAEVDPSWRRKAFDYIRAYPDLDFLLLSKRLENAPAMLPEDWGRGWGHVHIGGTVENQARARVVLPLLVAIPAARRFLSMEPLLEEVDVLGAMPEPSEDDWDEVNARDDNEPEEFVEECEAEGDWVNFGHDLVPNPEHAEWLRARRQSARFFVFRRTIDQVIVGGESGRAARPFDLAWARGLRDLCRQANVAYFCKQLGARPIDGAESSTFGGSCSRCEWGVCEHGSRPVGQRDRIAGADFDEFPPSVKLRQLPTGALR